MGGYPSPNFQLARQLSRTPAPNVDAVLDALARERFGPEGAAHARKAWTLMSDGLSPVSVSYQRGLHFSGPDRVRPIRCIPRRPATRRPCGEFPTTIWTVGAARTRRRCSRHSSRRWPRAGGRALPSCRRPWKRRRPIGATRPKRTCASPGRRPSISNRSPTRRVSSLPATPWPNPRARCRPNERRRLQAEIKRLPGIRDRLGPPALYARARGFADRLRTLVPVLLLAAGLGGKSGQLPLVVGALGTVRACAEVWREGMDEPLHVATMRKYRVELRVALV